MKKINPFILELAELGDKSGPGTKIGGAGSTKEEIAANLLALFDEHKRRRESEEDYFNWEEIDYIQNRAFYDNELEDLEEVPTREKIRRKNVKEID